MGGPRKEFFAILMRDIKQKYFDPVKEWSKDYEVIGKIFGNYFSLDYAYVLLAISIISIT